MMRELLDELRPLRHEISQLREEVRTLRGDRGPSPGLDGPRGDTGPRRPFLQLEKQKPGGPIKDRVARPMIEAGRGEVPAGAAVRYLDLV